MKTLKKENVSIYKLNENFIIILEALESPKDENIGLIYNTTNGQYYHPQNIDLINNEQLEFYALYVFKNTKDKVEEGFTFDMEDSTIKFSKNPKFVLCDTTCTDYIKHDDNINLIDLFFSEVVNGFLDGYVNANSYRKENKIETPKKLQTRMYGFVPYNLSPIQKGIQFAHAVATYVSEQSNNVLLKQWVNEDKTMILLDGGTTNNSESNPGSMQKILLEIKSISERIAFAEFYEPDLNDSLSAFCFLATEKVYDEVNYPYDPEREYYEDELLEIFGDYYSEILQLRKVIKSKRLA